jgi:hypothetical protein
MGVHQTRELLHSKGNNHQTQEKAHSVGENLASYSPNKGLISRIHRELKKLNPQRINTPMKKWTHELNREFLKDEVQMASKYMKNCSTSLVIKVMQMKTTLRFHLTLVRIAIINGNNNNNAGKDVVKQEPLYTAGGNAN